MPPSLILVWISCLQDLVRNINTSMTQLNTMKLAVETGLTDRTSEQASSVRATEDRTRELHDMAKQLTRDAEREVCELVNDLYPLSDLRHSLLTACPIFRITTQRIKLQDSAARMELMLREQQSRHEAEARTLKVESARVQLLLEHQETERSRVMADVDSQRSDLHIERQRIETDRQLMLKDVAVERQELVKERAAAMSLRRESEERSRAECVLLCPTIETLKDRKLFSPGGSLSCMLPHAGLPNDNGCRPSWTTLHEHCSAMRQSLISDQQSSADNAMTSRSRHDRSEAGSTISTQKSPEWATSPKHSKHGLQSLSTSIIR
jgi:hypothetical protein